jgi:hypothetical protein
MLVATAAILLIGLEVLIHRLKCLADVGDTNPRWLAVTSSVGLNGGLVVLVWVWFLAQRGGP